MTASLEGKVALVTGGSRGIGRAIVEELAASGAAVAFSYREGQEAATQLAFDVSHVPTEALKAQMEDATEPMQKSFAGLMYCYALGDPIDMQVVLDAFPLKLTSVQKHISQR